MIRKERKTTREKTWEEMDPKELSRCEALTIGGYNMDAHCPNSAENEERKLLTAEKKEDGKN